MPESKSEYRKMLDGELYDSGDPELLAMRVRARAMMQEYNSTPFDKAVRTGVLGRLLGKMGTNVDVQTPFFCDYGLHIEVGDNFFANFNCVFLDCALISMGNNVFMGPAVQLYAAHHPLLASERIKGPELASPIRIGNNVWIGGATVICAGVTIGDNTTIGAGSVVVKDIPANVLAVGNPCRVVRTIG